MSRKLSLVMMLGLLFPLAATRIVAQTPHELVADVPFEFSVCGERLPAGTYKVRSLSSNPHVLVVSSDNSRSVIVACGRQVQAQKQPTGQLIFNRYENKYFLSELWLGEMIGTELFKSAEEQALLRTRREEVTIKPTETKR